MASRRRRGRICSIGSAGFALAGWLAWSVGSNVGEGPRQLPAHAAMPENDPTLLHRLREPMKFREDLRVMQRLERPGYRPPP